MFDLLRARRIEGAKRDIVGSSLTSFHRQMPAVVAGHTDLHILAKDRTCITRIAVVLSEMDTVCAQPFGEAYTVIDDERRIMVRADLLERLCSARNCMIINALEAQLEGRNRRGVQRCAQPILETRYERLWRNQVELARRTPFPMETIREIRVQFLFLHSLPTQALKVEAA